MKTYLVTGTAGFIGWKTAERLLEQGSRVIGIDNLNDYYDVRLKDYRLRLLRQRPGFSFFPVDIENREALEPLFAEHPFRGVLNLAARVGVRSSMEAPHLYLSANVQGTLNLLELMRKYRVKKMVLASTSSLYAGQPIPFSEELPVNTPISPYAASKKAAEVMAYSYHYLYQLDITVLRYFTVFGPAGRPDMSPFRFIAWIADGRPIKLYGDGRQRRDFTYIDDIADGTTLALKKVGYEIVNLGRGHQPISLNTIIQTIESHLDKKAVIAYEPFHKADMKETWADIAKAERMLNWKPKIDLEEGIERSIDWYLQNREWLKDIRI